MTLCKLHFKLIVGLLLLCLLTACSAGGGKPTPEASKRLLKLRGYNFDDKSFLNAVSTSDVVAVNTFIAAGINPDVTDENDSSGLIVAASRGDFEVVKALVNGHANLNLRDKQGFTALLRALQKKHDEVASYLLDQPGLDLNVQGSVGGTALATYVIRQREDVVKKLLARGANANVQDEDGDTALHVAMRGANLEIVKALLAKGADPNIKNKLGGTPLMWAATFGKDEVARELLRTGADPKLKDADGITASGWAAKNGHTELAQFLSEAEKIR